jgi:cell division septum initiation protein DivIVA
MNREQITRDDFPVAETGYDRASVDAHLAAVAASTAALEAQINALEVERDTLREQQLGGAAEAGVAAGAKPPADAVEDMVEPTAEPAETVEEAVAESVEPEPEQVGPGPESPESSDDEISARLTATRLALEGIGREQIRERLDEAYRLDDPDSLIDDVLARLD